MQHKLVAQVEKALGWTDATPLGRAFARGTVEDLSLCPRLLTPTKLLDIIMRRSLSHPQMRCFQHGDDVHPNHYLTTEQTRRGQSLPMVEMTRLGRLLETGCTLALDSVGTFDPTMEAACRALQWWSGERVQVNVYLTTKDAAGFNLHWDDHDVLIVQLAGHKSWEVRGTSRVAPMYRDAEPNSSAPEEIVWTGIMRSGDVMHIPRGYWHTATREDRSDDGFSLHVTFGLAKRTGVDWLTWLADHSREDERFRHDLEPGNMEQARELVRAAAQLVGCRPFPIFLTTRQAERPPARHVITHGVFGQPTSVVCVSEFRPQAEEYDDQVVVSAAGKRITFAAKVKPALEMLLSGLPVGIADVALRTGIDVTDVVEVLLTEGICAEATPELAAGYADLVS